MPLAAANATQELTDRGSPRAKYNHDRPAVGRPKEWVEVELGRRVVGKGELLQSVVVRVE